jgi:prepilin-type processing-associated H-X9-DG protein
MGVCGLNMSDTNGVLYFNSQISVERITDGASNTLLVVERPPLMMGGNWGWGWWESSSLDDVCIGMKVTTFLWIPSGTCTGPMYFGPGAVSASKATYVTSLTADPVNCHVNHAWSFHPNGANMLFGDGSVRFVTYKASTIMPDFATRSGGEKFVNIFD